MTECTSKRVEGPTGSTPEGVATVLPDGPLPARIIAGETAPSWTVEERMARYDVPAVSVAVIQGMGVGWTGAWGMLKNGEPTPATITSLFQCASISKFVAAVGALRLVRDGVLALDSDVAPVLQSWHLPREAYPEAVTLRRLLSHSAGTGTPGFEGYAADAPLPSLSQMLDGTPPANSPAVRLVGPPGEAFRYSGGGYLIVQQMMEDATGASFTDVMQERVFAPLGMVDSYYAPLDPALRARAASGHVGQGEPIPGHGPVHAESAAGGLWTTPSDLARLMIEVMRAYRGETGPVLTPELARDQLAPQFWRMGLGVRVLGEGSTFRFSHGGATRGWHGQLVGYPNLGEGLAVLTNGSNGYVVWPEIQRGVARTLGWPGWAPEVIEPVELSPAEIARYTGTYSLGGETVEVRAAPPGIALVHDELRWTAVPTSEKVFELLEFEGQVSFEARDGEVSGCEVWFGMPDWSPYRRWYLERIAPA